MVKQQLEKDLKKVVEELGLKAGDALLSISQNIAFGDYTSNIALQQAKEKGENSKQNPQEIAKEIVSHLSNLSYLDKVEIAGPGFINFFIKDNFITKQVLEILDQGENFGKNDLGKGDKVQVEFISANPTGPLTLANGRGGTIGDTLANVLANSGFFVEREYYVNDTGNQVRLLGESVLAVAGKVPAKEEHYQGEYVKELAEKFKDQLDKDALTLGHLLADHLLNNEIKPAVSRLGVNFDEYYSERSLHERSLVTKAATILKEKGAAYEKDGALWLKSTDYGDEKDRVLITSKEARGQEEPTYFLADIAYHLVVFERGFIKKINIWGADHHGYEKRVESALEALGHKGKLKVIFMQMVKLFKEGKEVRMSKRAGNFVTLDELLDTVGKDVARFFFLMYTPESHINFDLGLAKERSNKNPVYYVQYAHARMASILNKVEGAGQSKDISLLTHPAELALIRHLSILPDLISEIADSYQVHKLTTYAIQLSDLFHRFYEQCSVLNADTQELKQARLALVRATKVVLNNTLSLMGVEAPEKM